MFLYSVLFSMTLSHAEPATSCFDYKKDSIEINWTAYKTSEKKGVSGKLKSIQATINGKPQSVEDMILGTSFIVDPITVDSGDAGRDKNLRENFFKYLKNPKITGKVVAFASNLARVELQMNGVTKAVEFKVNSMSPRIEAVATIDILDFAMNESLTKLNEACLDLHKGKDGVSKTWSTVDLKISAEPVQICKKSAH
ncbi:MAG: YceI family protein [Bdellovibrionaceae bacterium]|nr:YceI family protein [Pseudobdellovibrionaceae bacterium]